MLTDMMHTEGCGCGGGQGNGREGNGGRGEHQRTMSGEASFKQGHNYSWLVSR